MKRLGIFIFYDKEGVVDRYIEFFLDSLKEMVDRIVIVVNGAVNFEGYEKLKRITDDIIYRDNKGYDAGGYRVALLYHVGREELSKYDELVLCNDTCYGPFVSFDYIWEQMDKKEGDFWGINCISNGLTDHMQAYFLVFRKHLLENEFLYHFFEAEINEEICDIREIIAVFEKGLYKKLVEHGYRSAVYIENNNLNMYVCGNILLREYGFPLLKKKCFDVKYNDNCYSAVDSLRWIDAHTAYDIDLILENAKRLYGFQHTIVDMLPKDNRIVYGPIFAINAERLNDFVSKADKLYIYGCGAYAKEIYHLYVKNSGKLKGFAVSDDREEDITDLYGYPIFKISELETDVSLIVAMNKKNIDEVRGSLRCRNGIFLF